MHCRIAIVTSLEQPIATLDVVCDLDAKRPDWLFDAIGNVNMRLSLISTANHSVIRP